MSPCGLTRRWRARYFSTVFGSVDGGPVAGEEVPARAEHAVAQERLAPEPVDADAVADRGCAGHGEPDLAVAIPVRDQADQAAKAPVARATNKHVRKTISAIIGMTLS